MKKSIIITLLLALSLITSCTSHGTQENCTEYKHARIETVELPSTGIINQSIPINLSFVSVNGCGKFGSIEETNQEQTKEIKVIAKYKGCLCTQELSILPDTYYFKTTKTGTHTLHFLQPDSTLITKTILIQ